MGKRRVAELQLKDLENEEFLRSAVAQLETLKLLRIRQKGKWNSHW